MRFTNTREVSGDLAGVVALQGTQWILAVSGAVVSMRGCRARKARGGGVMRRSARRCGRASSAATGHSVPGGSGTIFWSKASHAACAAAVIDLFSRRVVG